MIGWRRGPHSGILLRLRTTRDGFFPYQSRFNRAGLEATIDESIYELQPYKDCGGFRLASTGYRRVARTAQRILLRLRTTKTASSRTDHGTTVQVLRLQ